MLNFADDKSAIKIKNYEIIIQNFVLLTNQSQKQRR